MHELSRLCQEHGLLDVSALEQDLACATDARADHYEQIVEQLEDPKAILFRKATDSLYLHSNSFSTRRSARFLHFLRSPRRREGSQPGTAARSTP